MVEIKVPEIKSVYLSKFQRLQDEGKGFVLSGSRMLIEPIELGELTSASGIVLASPKSQSRGSFQMQMAHIAIVLLTGEDNKLPDSEYEVKPGNIVLVSEYGVKAYSNFPGLASYTEGALQLSATEQIQFLYESAGAFNDAMRLLNG